MKLRIHYLLLVMLLLGAWPAEALACSCAGDPPPCEAYWRADAVFAGTVVKSGSINLDDGAGSKRDYRLVHLTVDQPIRGMKTAEVDVVTGWGGGDCGFGFELGQRYLVYAYREEKGQRLVTSICTRTRLLSEAADDLAFIRSLPASNANGLIFGTVHKRNYQWKEGDSWELAIPGAAVTVEGQNAQYDAVTDDKGKFSVEGVPPGKYTVKLKLPSGLISPSGKDESGRRDPENEVEVVAHGCAETEFFLESDTRVRGRVIDAKGNPVARMNLNMRGSTPGHNQFLYATTDADGYFEFKVVPPGDYWLGYHIMNSGLQEDMPYVRTYLPGVPTRALATILHIKEGEKVSELTLQLPPPLVKRTVNGVVFTSDGRPATGASVYVNLNEEGEMTAFFSLRADEEGRFTLKIFEGLQYKISAYKELGPLRAQSPYIDIPMNLGDELLKLELPPLRPIK